MRLWEQIKGLEEKILSLEDYIDELRKGIIPCPFDNNLAIHVVVECIYLTETGYCEGIDVCPGNSDAWCVKKINGKAP